MTIKREKSKKRCRTKVVKTKKLIGCGKYDLNSQRKKELLNSFTKFIVAEETVSKLQTLSNALKPTERELDLESNYTYNFRNNNKLITTPNNANSNALKQAKSNYEAQKNIINDVLTLESSKDCSDFFKKCIQEIYSNAAKYINDLSAFDNHNKNNKEKRKKEFIEKLNKIGTDLKDNAEYTIISFNIKSLQFIILFTEILIASGKTHGNLIKNVSGIYRNVTDIYTDYEQLKKKVAHDEILKLLISNYAITQKNSAFNRYKTFDYKCPMLPGTNIILFLGEIDIKDMVMSIAKEIYILGMTMEMEFADGVEVSPLEFLLHDIIHTRNRIEGLFIYGTNHNEVREKELEFLSYINNDKTGLSPENVYDIYVILFILMHESMNEYHLGNEIISNLTFNFKPNFLNEEAIWINNDALGGLLPDTRSIDGDELKIKNNWDNIQVYINYIINLLKINWETCFKKEVKINKLN